MKNKSRLEYWKILFCETFLQVINHIKSETRRMLRRQLMRTMHDALLHYVTAGKMMRRGKDLLILARFCAPACMFLLNIFRPSTITIIFLAGHIPASSPIGFLNFDIDTTMNK